MITACIPLRYDEKRAYRGKSNYFCHIDYCLGSLLRQSIINQIIIVSHTPRGEGEKDDNLEYIAFRYGNEEKIRIIDLKHGNFMFHRGWLLNIGIKNASSEIVMAFDIDCILEPDFSKNSRKIFTEYPSSENMYVICCTGRQFDGEEMDWINFKYPEDFYKIYESLTPIQHGLGNMIVSREKVLEIGGYDEMFDFWGREDLDIAVRLGKVGLKKVNCFRAIHQPHITAKEIMGKEEVDRLEKKREIYFQMTFNYFGPVRNKNGWGEMDYPRILK